MQAVLPKLFWIIHERGSLGIANAACPVARGQSGFPVVVPMRQGARFAPHVTRSGSFLIFRHVAVSRATAGALNNQAAVMHFTSFIPAMLLLLARWAQVLWQPRAAALKTALLE